jgi:hypothetical protein
MNCLAADTLLFSLDGSVNLINGFAAGCASVLPNKARVIQQRIRIALTFIRQKYYKNGTGFIASKDTTWYCVVICINFPGFYAN